MLKIFIITVGITFVFVGYSMNVLSLVSLVEEGLDFGVSAPLDSILKHYEKVVERLLGRTEPYLRYGLERLRDIIGFDLRLFAHWKHFFVPMFFYVTATSSVNVGRSRYDSAIFTLIWGVPLALASAVASGSVPLDDPRMFPAIPPIIGFMVFQTGQGIWDASRHRYGDNTWWQSFRYFLKWFVLFDAILGPAAIFIVLWFEIGLSNPSVVAFLIFITLLAFRTLGVAAWAAAKDRDVTKTWYQKFKTLGGFHLGIRILGVLVGTLLVFVTDAGI